MSLLDDFSHSCIIMDKLTKPDGEGGYATEWSEGAEFANFVALDSSLEARQAEAQGVTSVYTGIVRKDVPIEYGSVYKDVATGAYFRVTSRPEEKQAPASASPMLQNLKSFMAEWLRDCQDDKRRCITAVFRAVYDRLRQQCRAR